MSVAKTILKRLFRVYAHIYHQHFDPVIQLQEEAHLNTSFKHFIFFVQVRTWQTVFSLPSYIIPLSLWKKNQHRPRFPSFKREEKLQAVVHLRSASGRWAGEAVVAQPGLGSWLPNEFWLNKASHLSCTHKTLCVCLSPRPCYRNSTLLIEENLHHFKNWLKNSPPRTDKRKKTSWSHLFL